MAILLGDKNLTVIEEVCLTESQTYTARRTGIADVICVGAGGCGGSSGKGNVLPIILNCTGGGAGGYSRKRIPITAGDTFTVVVGAGGEDATRMPGAGNNENGTAGGESTFDHATATATIALDSNGGAGGICNQTTTASGATYAGGAGGTASGGDVNFTGGRGGTITRSNNASNMGNFATGGGAVAVFGQAFNGGDINFTANGTTLTIAATGGAGVGGDGGNVAYGTSTTNGQCATSGGSASGEGNGFTAAQTAATSSGISALAKVDAAPVGGSRLPSHGGYGICGNSSTIVLAGNGGTGATKSDSSGFNQAQYRTIYGGNDRVPFDVDSASMESFTGYPQATGWGGGGGAAAGPGDDNASNIRIAAGNGAAFAGGGGVACTCDSELVSTNGTVSSSGRGGFGGGSGGCHLGTNVSNSTVEWSAGGDGLIIIQYLG
jgi:hypothetical protein